MAIVGRVNQYASLNVSGEFDEINYSTISAGVGQSSFITPGIYSWTVPTGVVSISVVAVGGGGGGVDRGSGGGGGALAYANQISVTPGQTLTVGVATAGIGSNKSSAGSPATNGGNSYLKRGATSLVEAGGGIKGTFGTGAVAGGGGGAVIVGTGGSGGAGGVGDSGGNAGGSGGGGAGGYSGTGGNGGQSDGVNATAGSGGGGGGGGNSSGIGNPGFGGGGVGINGQNTDGFAGPTNVGGGGGSGGNAGIGLTGGKFGGGGASQAYASNIGGDGGSGAVRIIWGFGANRYFPVNYTEDLPENSTNVKTGISGLGTYTSIEFTENIGVSTLTLNTYKAYDPVYDEFAGVLYGPGKGIYSKQNLNGSVDVYNEINEFDLTPSIVFSQSTSSLNEGGTINFSIATTNIEDGVPLYYEIITPSPTVTLTQSGTSLRYGNSISFDATTVNVGNGTTLSYDIVGTVSSSDFTDNTLTGITTVTGGIIDTITKTTTAGGLSEKTFTLNLRSQGNIVATSSAVSIRPGLYDFTTAIFTPGGASTQNGPTLVQAISGLTGPEIDSWKSNTVYFNVSSGIQLWTVPVTGTYSIEAFGAQGGSAGSRIGGKGTRMSGNFTLTQGEIIRILVGQRGQSGPHNFNTNQFVASGGGGTFVVRTPYNTNGSILLIAGGGGGAAQNTWTDADGRPALITTDGSGGGAAFGGGTGGNGGTNGTYSGPGAGFFGNGATPNGTSASEASKAFVNGGTGGRGAVSYESAQHWGGFGGGGGGGIASGGGGGYSGGGAGDWSSQQQAGGGGSYNSGTSQSNQQDSRTGNGQVTITLI